MRIQYSGHLADTGEQKEESSFLEQYLDKPIHMTEAVAGSPEIATPSGGSVFMGGLTSGLVGFDPELETHTFGGGATKLGGEFARIGLEYLASSAVMPGLGGGGTLARYGIRAARKAPVFRLAKDAPISFLRTNVTKHLSKEAVRDLTVGASVGMEDSFFTEEDPLRTAAIFGASDFAISGAGRSLFAMYKRAQRAKQAASATDKLDDVADEGVSSLGEVEHNTKILYGESPFPSKAKSFTKRAEQVTKVVKSRIANINKNVKRYAEIEKVKESQASKVQGVSDAVGLKATDLEFAPENVVEKYMEGIGTSAEKVKRFVNDLGGLSEEEKGLVFELYGEGTKLIPKGQLDRYIKKSAVALDEGLEFQVPEKRTAITYKRTLGEAGEEFEKPFIGREGAVSGRRIVSPERRAEIQQAVSDLKYDLNMANVKTQLGLKQSMSDAQVEKYLDDYIKKLDKEGVDIYAPTKEQRQISKEIQRDLDKIINSGIDNIDPKLKDTAEYVRFTEQMQDFAEKLEGKRGIDEQRLAYSEAIETIERAARNSSKREKVFQKDLKKILKKYDVDVVANLNEIEGLVGVGALDDITKLSDKSRRTILDYMAYELDALPDDMLPPEVHQQIAEMAKRMVGEGKLNTASVKDAMENLPEMVLQTIMKNPVNMQSTIDRSGNDLLRKAYYLYQASLGDQMALRRLKAMEHTTPGTLAKEMRLAAVERIDEINPEALSHTAAKPPKGKGVTEVPPPDGGEPPVGGTIEDSFDRVTGQMHDITWFEKNLRGLGRIAEVYIERTKDLPVFNQIFRGVKRLRDVWQDAYITARRDYVQMAKAIDDFMKNELKPDTDQGKYTLDFIRNIDESLESVRRVTTKNLDDQDPATRALYERYRGWRKKGLDKEDALEQIAIEETSKQTKEVQALYKKYRAFDDEILEKYNTLVDEVNAKVEAGEYPERFKMKHINRKAGHSPIIYDGDYMIRVIERTPKGTKIIHSDFAYGQEQAYASIVKWMEEQKNLYGKVKGEIQLIPRIFRDDPDLNSLSSIMDEGKNLFGQSAGFIDESVAKGKFKPEHLHEVFFGGARPRLLNAVEKRVGVAQALHLRMFMANKAVHFTKPRLETEIIASAMEKNGINKWAKYMRTFANDQIGRSRGLENSVDEFINYGVDMLYKIPVAGEALMKIGITPGGRNARALARGLTFMGRAGALGINLGTAFINTMLFGTNVIPLVGFKHAMFATANLKNVFTKNNPYKGIFDRLGLQLTHGGLGYMENIGQTSGALGRNMGKYMDWLDSKLMWAFNTSEDLTRGASAMAFRNQADDLAKLVAKDAHRGNWQAEMLEEIAQEMGKRIDDVAVLDEYAVRMVRKTNFIFDLTDAPEMFRSVPLKPFLQFKNYFAKELEFIFEVGARDKKDLMKVIGAFTALGGAFALPGTQEIDAVSRFAFNFSPKMWAEENLPEVAVAGVPIFAGINMSTRIMLGDITGLTKNIGGMQLSKLQAGIRYWKQGDLEKAETILTPNGVRAITEAYELFTTGKITDPFSGGITTVDADDTNPFALAFRAMTRIPTRKEAAIKRKKKFADHLQKWVQAKRKRGMARAYSLYKKGKTSEANEMLREHGIEQAQFKAYRKQIERSPSEFIEHRLPTSERELHPYLINQ